MTAEPQITVITSILNAEKTLKNALFSIQWQTFQNWKWILINDGSDDDTQKILNQAQSEDSRIQIIHHTARKGLASRLNEGVNLVRTPFIARMDADDIAYPSRLEKQLTFLKSRPDIDLIASNVMLFSQRKPLGKFPLYTEHADICQKPEAGFFFPHPTWMGKTAWFQKFPYDENLLRGQDQDLLSRTWKQSRFAALNEILLAYCQDDASLKRRLKGRLNHAQAIWKKSGPYSGLKAGLNHCLKGTVDLIFFGLGQGEFLLRQWACNATPEEYSEFLQLMQRIEHEKT